jgi:uncharacterized coiled-coil protein SlyX
MVFVYIMNLRKMLKIFQRKNKFNSTLYDLELKMEHQQKQIDEIRTLVLEISKQLNTIEIELNYLSNQKYGKSI